MKIQTADWKNLPFYRTYRTLKDLNYILGDITGKQITEEPVSDQDQISVILPIPVATKRLNFWLFEWVTYQRVLLGNIYFLNESKNANHTHWVFEVYGKGNLEEAEHIAKYLQEKLNIESITVNLVNEDQMFETDKNEFYQDF